MEFKTESEMGIAVRKLLEEKVLPKADGAFQVLKSDKALDIPICKAGVAYYYNFTINDIDGDPMYLWVDWDDGTQGPYTGPYESGIVNLGHNWSEEGDYTIRAKVKDVYGNESEWGTLEVTMPRTHISIFSRIIQFLQHLIQRFPMLERILCLFPVFNRMLGLQ